MVGSDTGGDGELELLGLCEALSGQISGVEGGGDDDLGVDELLVKGGVLAVLVRGGYEGVALVLEPLADAELVLGCTQELRDLIFDRISMSCLFSFFPFLFLIPAILEEYWFSSAVQTVRGNQRFDPHMEGMLYA